MNPSVPHRAAQLASLTETGRGTLMGMLLRRFWHPIALTDDVAPGKAVPVRVLGDDLTLYRGATGTPHLVGGRCAHRCTVLHTGWVEGDDIRCMYHGWRYDDAGTCIEIPAEDKPRAKPPRIEAFPVEEYGGLIFAWLGEGSAPAFDLPRKSVFEGPKKTLFAKREVWDCNWFQQVENSMDALHLNFAHRWGAAGEFGARIAGGGIIPKLQYEETASGIRQIATRSADNVRISDWTFPNNNHVVAVGPDKNDPWVHISAWPVPVDDHRTMRYTIYAAEIGDPANVERYRRGFDLQYDPAHHAENLFRGDVTGITEPGLVSAQDYVAVRGQGVIVDRNAENLSTSDAGVLFLRKVFLRELEALRSGMPLKHWHKLKDEPHLKAPPPVTAA